MQDLSCDKWWNSYTSAYTANTSWQTCIPGSTHTQNIIMFAKLSLSTLAVVKSTIFVATSEKNVSHDCCKSPTFSQWHSYPFFIMPLHILSFPWDHSISCILQVGYNQPHLATLMRWAIYIDLKRNNVVLLTELMLSNFFHSMNPKLYLSHYINTRQDPGLLFADSALHKRHLYISKHLSIVNSSLLYNYFYIGQSITGYSL